LSALSRCDFGVIRGEGVGLCRNESESTRACLQPHIRDDSCYTNRLQCTPRGADVLYRYMDPECLPVSTTNPRAPLPNAHIGCTQLQRAFIGPPRVWGAEPGIYSASLRRRQPTHLYEYEVPETMFVSWEPVTNNNGSEFLLSKRPHTFDPVTAKTGRPVACSQCRAQKVRCTGERNSEGCGRCQTMRRKCTYPPSRRSSTATGDDAPASASTKRQPEAPTPPVSTEDPLRPLLPAPTHHVADAWTPNSQDYPNSTEDFCNFLLDHEPMENCGGRFAFGDERPHFRNPEPEGLYPAASDLEASWSPGMQARLPHAEPLFSSQTSDAGTPQPSEPSCQCLHQVVIVMDRLELLGELAGAHPPVDSILAAHRKALRQAEDMLICSSCASRIDNMTILTFLTDRCYRIMSVLSSRYAAGASVRSAGHPGVKDAPVTAIGSYRLDNDREYMAVVRVLVRLALDRLLGLVDALHEVGRRLGSVTMGRRLGVCRKAVKGLLDDL
jgi:hypothetical protein